MKFVKIRKDLVKTWRKTGPIWWIIWKKFGFCRTRRTCFSNSEQLFYLLNKKKREKRLKCFLTLVCKMDSIAQDMLQQTEEFMIGESCHRPGPGSILIPMPVNIWASLGYILSLSLCKNSKKVRRLNLIPWQRGEVVIWG